MSSSSTLLSGKLLILTDMHQLRDKKTILYKYKREEMQNNISRK